MLAADALEVRAPHASAATTANNDVEPRVRPTDWNRFFQTARNGNVPADPDDTIEFMGIGDWLLIGESEGWGVSLAFIIFLHWGCADGGKKMLVAEA